MRAKRRFRTSPFFPSRAETLSSLGWKHFLYDLPPGALRSDLATTYPQWPADPELSGDEKKQYEFLIGNNHWGDAFMVQQSFLLRKRLNLLNVASQALLASSKKVETASVLLAGSTLLLVVISVLTWLRIL